MTIGRRARTAWLAVGAVGLAVFLWGILTRGGGDSLNIGRDDAARIARSALAARGVTLGPQWRVMPTPDDGRGAPHEFVASIAGETRRQELLDTYLARPRWTVRVATFRGDVAERAEEWRVVVSDAGAVEGVFHTLPEARAGASLAEAEARTIAHGALLKDFALDASAGAVREVLARPAKLKARTDWTFTFTDLTVPALPQGEPRISIVIAGDEVAQARRFIFVPDDWNRRARAAQTRNTVGQVVISLLFAGILVVSAIAGVVAWSRRRYSARLFFAAAGLMFALSLANAANGWPAALAALQTSQPLQLQVLALIGIGGVGLTMVSVLVGLAIGGAPHRVARGGVVDERVALQMGIAAGLSGAAVAAAASWLRTPEWADFVNVAGLGTLMPVLAAALGPLPGFLTRVAIVMSAFSAIDAYSSGWTRRRLSCGAALLLIGILGAGLPQGGYLTGWMLAAALSGVALLGLYVLLLRADLTIAVPALGVMVGLGSIAQGISRPYPGALVGSFAAAALVAGLAWWWFRAIRRARAKAVPSTAGVAETQATGPARD
jgi:hypothetical protein